MLTPRVETAQRPGGVHAHWEVILPNGNDMLAANLKLPGNGMVPGDGEELPFAITEMGGAGNLPPHLSHRSHGRFPIVRGDSDFVIHIVPPPNTNPYV